MLLGIFAAHGATAHEPRPVAGVPDLIPPYLEELEAEAAARGRGGWVLAAHFARVFTRALPRELLALLGYGDDGAGRRDTARTRGDAEIGGAGRRAMTQRPRRPDARQAQEKPSPPARNDSM